MKKILTQPLVLCILINIVFVLLYDALAMQNIGALIFIGFVLNIVVFFGISLVLIVMRKFRFKQVWQYYLILLVCGLGFWWIYYAVLGVSIGPYEIPKIY